MAHQIASIAIFAAPLLTIAANPQAILSNPAVDTIKSVPPVWDETIVLPGSEIGELAAFARRKGETWFLAVMCGPQAKTIQVPLSFLGGHPYRAALINDVADGSAVHVEQTSRSNRDSLIIEMHAGGGFLARFSKGR